MNNLAKELSDTMQKPMYLEAEKASRMLAIKKKKYAFWMADCDPEIWKDKIKGGIKIPNPEYAKLKDYKKDKYVILVKGIILARRDNFKFLRDAYWNMLTMILEKENFNKILKVLINNCLDLYKNKIPWTDLIIIRQLGAHYKSDNYFMKVFGDEIKKLGRPANPGDRLEYLIVKDKDNSELLGQRLRLPEVYNERKGTPEEEVIDTLYYLNNLFIKSIEQLWQIGFNKELDKLNQGYKIQDSYKIIEETKKTCLKDKGAGVDGICQYFSYDYLKINDYFENELPKLYNENTSVKYLVNKYKKSKCKYLSGRDVLNIRITPTPIKLMIKAIKMDKLKDYINGIMPELTVN
jgi:hypothetical protein